MFRLFLLRHAILICIPILCIYCLSLFFSTNFLTTYTNFVIFGRILYASYLHAVVYAFHISLWNSWSYATLPFFATSIMSFFKLGTPNRLAFTRFRPSGVRSEKASWILLFDFSPFGKKSKDINLYYRTLMSYNINFKYQTLFQNLPWWSNGTARRVWS